ncbi:MAG: alpha/beta hydrolase [Sphingomonas bacterium]|uniref:alpha/beta hydrolase n=1 Tax=Sphingomonas bacterium TaxID=1895847 RepID=UPI00261B3028|nr:alpha/beta hydrolase [Sphingomonas bacterium]MDB5704401.1 alpha/beta hydrolase [Sphingomonas bacterium]
MAHRLTALATLLATLPLAGCITVPPSYGPVAGPCPAHTADPATAANPVYFVTTGRPDCLDGTPLALSIGRGSLRPYGAVAPSPLRYGVATAGTAALPVLSLADAGAWHARLGTDLRGKGGRVLLYVHGYNNTPAEALSQADQIALAAGFDGPVIAFLWPSQHSLAKYTWDEENARWSQAWFDAVLADLAGRAGDVVLVSHSMGNDIAIEGLRRLQASAPGLAAKVRTVVLAAPDLDRELFDRDLAPAIVGPGRRVAVFASGHDIPLRTSWAVHGNPRAGDVGCAFAVRRKPAAGAARCYPAEQGRPGEMIVIDGSDIAHSRFGHGNHIETPEGRAVLRRIVSPVAGAPGMTERVLVLRPGAAPECAGKAGRLGLAFRVVGCGVGK